MKLTAESIQDKKRAMRLKAGFVKPNGEGELIISKTDYEHLICHPDDFKDLLGSGDLQLFNEPLIIEGLKIIRSTDVKPGEWFITDTDMHSAVLKDYA